MKPMKKLGLGLVLFLVILGGVNSPILAAPVPIENLHLSASLDVANELGGYSASFNPRSMNAINYCTQYDGGIACYQAGTTTLLNKFSTTATTFMALPFPNGTYVLAAGANNSGYFARFADNLSAGSRQIDNVSHATPITFDWVDNTTIIYVNSANTKQLLLATVSTEPFSVTNTAQWTTSVSGIIRNVRVGDNYADYAYYGESDRTPARFWAINLTTGASAQLGSIAVINYGSDYGLWTAKEVDGYLYLQTTDNGILVYHLDNATKLGSLVMTYTKAQLDNATDMAGQNPIYYGFDVVDKASRMLISTDIGEVFELSSPVIGTLHLQDFVGDNRTVTAEVRLTGSTTAVRIDNVTLSASGTFTLTDVAPDNYTVAVKASHWLRAVKTLPIDTLHTNLGVFEMVNGDADDNNTINEADLAAAVDGLDLIPTTSADLTLVYLCLDLMIGDPGYDPDADFDGDGIITSSDVSIVLAGLWMDNVDLDGDGEITSGDLAVVLKNFGLSGGQ